MMNTIIYVSTTYLLKHRQVSGADVYDCVHYIYGKQAVQRGIINVKTASSAS